MSQQRLWVDSLEDAVSAVIIVAGGNKPVGAAMWPEMSVEEAARRVTHCLDTRRREKFSGDDILVLLKLGRTHKCDVLANYLMEESGYRAPQRQSIEEVANESVAAVERAHAEVERAMAKFKGMVGLLS